MQTALWIDDDIYRESKAEAARRGLTLARFIEDALRAQLDHGKENGERQRQEIDERNRLMEALLQRAAHFRVGPQPTRAERNER